MHARWILLSTVVVIRATLDRKAQNLTAEIKTLTRREWIMLFFPPTAWPSDYIEPHASFTPQKSNIHIHPKFKRRDFKYSISNIFASVPWILTRDLIKLSRLSLMIRCLTVKAGCIEEKGTTEQCRGDNSLFLYHSQHAKPCIIHLKLL